MAATLLYSLWSSTHYRLRAGQQNPLVSGPGHFTGSGHIWERGDSDFWPNARFRCTLLNNREEPPGNLWSGEIFLTRSAHRRPPTFFSWAPAGGRFNTPSTKSANKPLPLQPRNVNNGARLFRRDHTHFFAFGGSCSTFATTPGATRSCTFQTRDSEAPVNIPLFWTAFPNHFAHAALWQIFPQQFRGRHLPLREHTRGGSYFYNSRAGPQIRFVCTTLWGAAEQTTQRRT